MIMQAGNSGLVEFSSLAGEGGEYQVVEKITNAIVVTITIFIFTITTIASTLTITIAITNMMITIASTLTIIIAITNMMITSCGRRLTVCEATARVRVLSMRVTDIGVQTRGIGARRGSDDDDDDDDDVEDDSDDEKQYMWVNQ